MAEVAISINGRSYGVVCDDGQQGHVTRLGEMLDERVRDLAAKIGQVGDARMVVLAALTIADDLATAREEIRELRAQPQPSLEIPHREADAAASAERQRQEEALAERLEGLAERIEGLAARLEAA